MMGYGGQQAAYAAQAATMAGYQQNYYSQVYAQYAQQAAAAAAQGGNSQAAAAWQQAAGQTGQAAGGQGAGQQQQTAQAQMAAQQAQKAPGAEDGVGNERAIQVSGCTHGTVGTIVRGAYTLNGENHGKASYKKDQQVNGLDVMLYYWDERDGPSFCGWWFGPKVGGDQVWAYHPSRTATTPPKSGWKVPYDGPVDSTFLISGRTPAQAPAITTRFGQGPGWTNPNVQQDAAKKQQQLESLKKLEEMRKMQQVQQQEIQRRQLEENRKKLEEANKMRVEQAAVFNIRRVLQKMRVTTPELYEQHEKELLEVREKELEACGSQKERMAQEVAQGLEQAKQRVVQLVQQHKRMEELLILFEELVTTAENAAKTLKEEAEPFSTPKEMELEEVKATAKAVDDAGREAKEKMKACTDLILTKGHEMKAPDIMGQPPSESKQKLAMLLQRMNECQRGMEVTLASCRDTSDKQVKKAEARKVVESMEATFDKYDADKDGFLSKPEVKKYAKGVYDLTLGNATMDSIMQVVMEEGSKGVKKDHFQKLKVAIGIEREKVKDAKRKEARVAREKEIAILKGKLQERVTATEKRVTAAAVLVDKAETEATPLPTKGSSMVSTDMMQLADEVAEVIKEAKDEAATLKKDVTDLAEGVDAELQAWLTGEIKKLEEQLAVFEPKLARAGHLATRFREEARIKEAEEMYILEKRALGLLKNHKRVRKMTSEDLFAEVDTKKDGKIDEREFIAFFGKCEKLPKKEKKTDEATDEDEEQELSKEDLAKVFEGLDDEGETGSLSKDKFTNIVRTFMKVARDTVITHDVSIKESKTLRRLDIGELVEVLEGPVKEPTVDVWRVRTQVLKDGLKGWITISGNQGSVFLEEGGDTFKVVKDTIMTESFELDGDSSKDATRKLKDTTRKLKEGEIVEVREWARKDEKSGLMRMKCKAKSDGATGWVTTVGNQGTVYVEVI